MNRIKIITAVALSISFFSVGSQASGTTSYGNSSYGNSSKQVDRYYEKGKSVYYASSDGKRNRYCVKNAEQLEPVSRKSLKKFTGTSAGELKESLVRCDAPSTDVASLMGTGDAGALMYYLNKRYRLNLYDS